MEGAVTYLHLIPPLRTGQTYGLYLHVVEMLTLILERFPCKPHYKAHSSRNTYLSNLRGDRNVEEKKRGRGSEHRSQLLFQYLV